MNKDDLISKVASSVGLSKTEAAKTVDAVFSNISGSLKNGNEVLSLIFTSNLNYVSICFA